MFHSRLTGRPSHILQGGRTGKFIEVFLYDCHPRGAFGVGGSVERPRQQGHPRGDGGTARGDLFLRRASTLRRS